ncbi:MAG: PAS domain S-box protein [Gammaproteobacteria bacterium]|nr:PAS domain S-box protein [Gammaproteobacteria bacterium]
MNNFSNQPDINMPIRVWPQMKLAATIFIPLLLLWWFCLALHYEYNTLHNTKNIQLEQTKQINVSKLNLEGIMHTIMADLDFLANHVGRSDLNASMQPDIVNQLAREMLVFLRVRGGYDQVRLLDLQGNEVIRINNNNDKPQLAPRASLRNKAKRYYFPATVSLPKGEIYVSPMDLNVEDNKIEYPIKPTIRIGTPIRNSQGTTVGVFLLNYNASPIIKSFRQSNNSGFSQTMLLNQNGYWLASPNVEDEWDFMFSRSKVFADEYPVTWPKIMAQNAGQLYNKHGMFTFNTVHPNTTSADAEDDPNALFWKLVTFLPKSTLDLQRSAFIRQYGAFYLSLLLLGLISSFVIANITLHRRMMQGQRDYERRFRHTLENIQLAAISIDTAGNVIFCNDYLLKILGWKREQILHHNWLNIFSPEDKQQRDQERVEKILSGEVKDLNYQGHWLSRSGSLNVFSWVLTPLVVGDDNICGVTMVGTNISQKQEIEERIRLLSRAVEQSPSTVMITNAKAEITYVNYQFEQRTGYTLDEIKGLNPRLLKSGEMIPQQYHEMWQSIIKDGRWHGELHNKKKDGTLHWEEVTIVPIRSEKGRLTHYLSVKEDITERKRLAEEVQLRNQEVAKNRELAAMGRMAGMVAHDLRNPMSSIRMTLQMLSKREGQIVSQSIAELTEISLQQISYMDSLLTDLLIYSRPDQLKISKVNGQQLVTSALNSMQSVISDKKVKVNLALQNKPLDFDGDSGKLCRVLANLVSNAIQAHEGWQKNKPSRSQAVIWINEYHNDDDSNVIIEICDNGPGIDLDNLSQFFEPFYTERAKGTGLGLSIVQRIIEQHQGHIKMSLNKAGGTCVQVILPLEQQLA